MATLTPFSRWSSRGEAVQCVAEYMADSGKRTFQSPKSCGGEVILLCTGSKNGGDCPVKVRIRRTKVKHATSQEWYIPQNGLVLEHSESCTSAPKQARSKMVSCMMTTYDADPSPCLSMRSWDDSVSTATKPDTYDPYTSVARESMPTPPKEYESPRRSHGSPLPPLRAVMPSLQHVPSCTETPTTSTPSSTTYQSVFSQSEPVSATPLRRRAHSHSASYSRPPFLSSLTPVQESTDLIHPLDSTSQLRLVVNDYEMGKRHRLEQALSILQQSQSTSDILHAATRLLHQDDHCCIVFVTLDPDLRWEWLHRELHKRSIIIPRPPLLD